MNAIVDDGVPARLVAHGRARPRVASESARAERRPVQLDRGETLRIVDGAGMVLRACSGVLWLTEERSARDTVLLPGDSHRIGTAGMALARAIGHRPARVVVERPEDVLPPRRVDVATPGSERAGAVAFAPRGTFLLRAWLAAIRTALGYAAAGRPAAPPARCHSRAPQRLAGLCTSRSAR